jgi:hypothetical protein
MRRWHYEQPLLERRFDIEQRKHAEDADHILDRFGGVLIPDETPQWIIDYYNSPDCHCMSGAGTMRKIRPYSCSCCHCRRETWERRREHRGRGKKKRDAIRYEMEAG